MNLKTRQTEGYDELSMLPSFTPQPVTDNIESSTLEQTLTSVLTVTPSGPDNSGTYK